MLSHIERLDVHNASVDTLLALMGRCGFRQLATGRVCARPERHQGPCELYERDRALATAAGEPGCPRTVEELDRTSCLELVAGDSVGRFVLLESSDPVAVPVNYVVADHGTIIFRTRHRGILARGPGPLRMSFEVDHADPEAAEGWSVVISGQAHVITGSEPLAPAEARDLHPSAGENWGADVRLEPEEVSGRRLRASWSRQEG